jgi:hypothetical protein
MKTQLLLNLSLTLGLLLTSSISSLASAKTAKNTVAFDICAESKTWKRPSPVKQRGYLEELIHRYNAGTVERLGGDYWNRNVFVFVDYPGGSGTYDINNLSGLWSAPKLKMLSKRCEDYSTNLSSQKIAGIWLFSNRVKNIKWVKNHYVMQVDSTGSGIQFLQIQRHENINSLPLKVIDQNGNEIGLLRY